MLCDNISVNGKGHLCFARQDVVTLAEKYGTPLYIMDEDKVREKCAIYKKALTEAFGNGSFPLYASKALSCKQIYRIMKDENMGIDVVSPGEIYTASEAGFPMARAFFHGNNKTDADIRFAMDRGVGVFVCDGEDELLAIDKAAAEKGIKQRVMLRLTPGIDPHTHAKISTGKVDSKFGAGIETGQAASLVATALGHKNIELCGYHCHIGSQIFEISPFISAADIMLGFSAGIKKTLGYEAEMLNLGGGMGVRYTEEQPQIDYARNISGIAAEIKEKCASLGLKVPKILMEPGRSIVADAGLTVYEAGSIKQIPGFKNYVSIDGGMTDNPRYALYEAPYTVCLANRMEDKKDFPCTVAGRCCESGDLIQEGVLLPKPKRGDLVAVFTTGAYNYSMASNYNRVGRPAMVFLRGGDSYVAVRRESFEDIARNDI